jgi:hypothetical protein
MVIIDVPLSLEEIKMLSGTVDSAIQFMTAVKNLYVTIPGQDNSPLRAAIERHEQLQKKLGSYLAKGA